MMAARREVRSVVIFEKGDKSPLAVRKLRRDSVSHEPRAGTYPAKVAVTRPPEQVDMRLHFDHIPPATGVFPERTMAMYRINLA